MNYGVRGEDITYKRDGRETEISFTWIDGKRIYTESISRWEGGEPISETDKRMILEDLLRFTKGWFSKPIVVINKDDPSRNTWEQVCAEMEKWVRDIEYTSDQQNRDFERKMYLETLHRQGVLNINDTELHNEQELDDFLADLHQ